MRFDIYVMAQASLDALDALDALGVRAQLRAALA